jgi:hypothetical protein
MDKAAHTCETFAKPRPKQASMSTAENRQSRKYRFSLTRWLHILVAAVGLARAVSAQAVGVYFQNSYGLVSPSNIVTFSEFSPPPNTIITTQYQAYGVSFMPYVQYASIYNQTSGTPNIDPTACVANFQQYWTVVPTFSVVFDRPVSAAAFAVLTQPGTFEVTALWAGIEIPGGPHTFTGGFGPDRTTNFVGMSGVTFDELRISNIATSDGALVLDNLKFTPALVNSWTNLHSARWDSLTNWSLRTLPASNQTVNIANEGYKAVNIDNGTVANFPGSLTVSNLLVSAPNNGLSTLLLNYAGLNTPLKVLNDCVIGTNGTIANYYSSLELDGNGLLVNAPANEMPTGGSFTQVGGLTVINGPFFLRSGLCNATNGNLTLGDVTIGAPASFCFGYFTQDGGSIAAQRLRLDGGAYTLASGTLYAIGGTYVGGSASFNHNGGTNYGDITITNCCGSYRVSAGMAKGNLLSVAADFEQRGGLVDMQAVNWFGQLGGLYGGILRCETFNVSGRAGLGIGTQGPIPSGSVSAGSFSISGTASVTVDGRYALYVTNSIDLQGDSSSRKATLSLHSAAVHASNLTMHDHSMIVQDNGSFGSSVQIDNNLFIEGGQFVLQGGTLDSWNLGVGLNSGYGMAGGSSFTQNLGQNSVHGTLSISGNYDLTGGNLAVQNLYLRGSLSLAQLNTNFPATFTNTGLVDLGGRIAIGLSNAWGGSVLLSTNAVIDFIGTPAQLRFLPSSPATWAPGALLVISNWNNSGNTHVFFGNNASALSASQLRQITFSNPGGFPSGNYPAQLLSTGELVPAPRPTLQSARSGSALALTWPSGFQLLSATNVAGPYTPVSGATSPWTNLFSKPQEFFRLQGF